MANAQRVCLFCEIALKGNRAREHAFAEWALKALGAEKYSAIHYERTDAAGWSDRSMAATSFVEGRVCKTCNNGWMSDLEVAVRPTLEQLWNTPGALDDLTLEQRAVVARWAAKTGYMVLSASPYGYAVPQAHRSVLMPPSATLAQGVVVCGADHTPRDPIPAPTEIGWRYERSWRLGDRTPRALQSRLSQANYASYKVTLRLRRLMLTVGYWPDSTWRIERWHEVHHQIAPESPHIVARGLGPLADGMSHEVIVDVHRNLGIRLR
jgi:hypothetical protein